MAWILDTDHLSILQRRSQPDYDRLQTRLQQQPLQEISTTIVSFQEQVRGWLSYLNQARDSAGIIRAYAEMHELLGYYCRASVLPFHRDAQDRFADLRHQRIRVAIDADWALLSARSIVAVDDAGIEYRAPDRQLDVVQDHLRQLIDRRVSGRGSPRDFLFGVVGLGFFMLMCHRDGLILLGSER